MAHPFLAPEAHVTLGEYGLTIKRPDLWLLVIRAI